MIVDGIDLDDMDNRVLLIVQLVCARGAMCACDWQRLFIMQALICVTVAHKWKEC